MLEIQSYDDDDGLVFKITKCDNKVYCCIVGIDDYNDKPVDVMIELSIDNVKDMIHGLQYQGEYSIKQGISALDIYDGYLCLSECGFYEMSIDDSDQVRIVNYLKGIV